MKKITALFTLCLGLTACQQPSLETALPYHAQLQYGTLNNGLNYYVLANPEPSNRVYLRLVVNAGSMHEDDDQKGVAHLVEHMAFNGSQKFPENQIISALEKLGMKFARDINAFTDFENTVYTLNLDKNDPQSLELAFDVVNEWIAHLTILDKDLDNERSIVEEEWRRRLSPMLRLGDKKSAVEMAGSRYAERDPIGDMQIIRTISRQRVIDFYRKWYRPDNMSLIIVGDIHSPNVISILKEKFNTRPSQSLPPLEKVDFSIPLSNNLKVASISEKGTLIPTLEWSFLQPAIKQETLAGYKQDLIQQILIRLTNLRLQNWHLIKQQKLDSANFYRPHLGKETVQNIFLLQLIDNQYEKALQKLFAFLAEIKQNGFSTQEFQQEIKRLVKLNEKQRSIRSGSLKLADDMIIAVANQQTILGNQERYQLNQRFLNEITLNDINQAFQQMINIPSQLLLITQPYPAKPLPLNRTQVSQLWQQTINAVQPQWQEQVQSAVLPRLNLATGDIKKIRHWEKGDITEYQLSNGSKLIYHYSDKTPNQVSFKALTTGGLRAIPTQDYHLLRSAVTVVDDSGVGELSLNDIQHIFAQNPIAFTTLLDEYKQGFAGAGKNHQLEALLTLFHLKLQGTPIANNAFERYQKETTDHFRQQDKETEFIKQINKLRYPNQPTIYSAEKQQLLSFSPTQLQQSYQKYILANTDFTYFIIGDISQKEVEKLAKRYLAPLKIQKTNRTFSPLQAKTPNRSFTLKGLDEPRAEVEIYFSVPNQWHPSVQYQLDLLGDVLQEKLRLILREQVSGIYAVNSWFAQEKEQTAIEGKIEFSCDPNRVQELLQHTEYILETLINDGIESALLNKKINEKHTQIKQQFDHLISVATIIEQSFWNENSPNSIYLYQQLEQIGSKILMDKLAKKILAKANRFNAILMP